MADSQTTTSTPSVWGWRGTVFGISQRIKQLLETKEQSDIQFAVGQQYGEEQVFDAHKFVLSASSDVFYTMFYGSIPNNEKTIKLPDIPAQAFAIMLKYMYTDVVEDLNLDYVMPTLYCAKKYGIPLLVALCADYAIKAVNKSTCFAVLEAAKILAAEDVVQKCLEIVDTNCSELLQSADFLGLKNQTLRLIFSRDTLIINEEEVYGAAQRWGLKTCEEYHIEPTASNQRRMLGETLVLIRFPLMSDEILADGPSETGLLLKEEMLKIYQFKHGSKKPDIPFSATPRSKPMFTFCDRQWVVLDQLNQDSGKMTASNAFLDENKRLHLRLSHNDGVWKGAGIQSADALGFGCYEFRIEARLDQLDPNIVFAMCSQATNQPGFGVQFARLGNADNARGRFAVCRRNALLPSITDVDRCHNFSSAMDGEYSMHFCTYVINPDGIWFGLRHENQQGAQSGWEDWWHGSTNLGHLLPVSICLSSYLGQGPLDGRDVEIVLHSFRFFLLEHNMATY